MKNKIFGFIFIIGIVYFGLSLPYFNNILNNKVMAAVGENISVTYQNNNSAYITVTGLKSNVQYSVSIGQLESSILTFHYTKMIYPADIPSNGVVSWLANDYPGGFLLGGTKYSAILSRITKPIKSNIVSTEIIIPVPKITNISPLSGKAGDIVLINGENLLSVDKVYFGSVDATYEIPIGSNGKLINVKVPSGAINGKISIKSQNFGSVTSADNFNIINNNVIKQKPVSIIAKDITTSSVKIVTSGTLDQTSYDFYIYDSSIYNLKDTSREMFALASKHVDLENPVNNNLSINFSGIKLDPSSQYVAVLDYRITDPNMTSPTYQFKVPTDITAGKDIINILDVTQTTVNLEAIGLSAGGNNYKFYVYNDTEKTPNTKYDSSKTFSPMSTEDNNVLPIQESFTGLVTGNNYIAALYKNNVIVSRVPFITKSNEAVSTTTNGGIVPKCNTGAIDTTTGQYSNPCDFKYFMDLINGLIKFMLFVIATPFVAIIIMYTGYLFLTAGGSAGQTEKAKKILLNVVVGYAIALAAWLIINTMISSLKVDTSINTFLEKQ